MSSVRTYASNLSTGEKILRVFFGLLLASQPSLLEEFLASDRSMYLKGKVGTMLKE